MQDNRIVTDNVLVVGNNSLVSATAQIASCERCDPDKAEMLIESVLDEITGSKPSSTTYFFSEPIFCPKCRGAVRENSLVEWDGGIEVHAI